MNTVHLAKQEHVIKKYKHQPQGFSLVEILVVLVGISILSTILVVNSRSSKTNATARHQISAVIVADIRRAQSLALSGSNFQGQAVCGYGVHYLDKKSYIIYAGTLQGPSCANGSRNYQAGLDSVVFTVKIDNAFLSISGPAGGPSGSFRDVFFESPDPKVYLNNIHDISGSADIHVVTQGQACNSTTCTTITVNGSGSVDVAN